ncbi:3-hydroxyanthranilate 3,4-dioxygenase [Aureivirga sp. CE67]|uniref:3-hydroxyanthranilate 3,4-dioxygenase n=1 Tax=Aureivirga sp. CE67 TaxID=1788983 RepID=UPI0018C98B65|nr:3-hydroxyanthranilate 3,4-dioxygenase [Aureivirga sp. CE67]
MKFAKPFNLQKWIEENRDLLKPPVANKNLYKESGDYIVMIVGGPNVRKDYHYNDTEEIFYQLEGDIKVIAQVDGEKQEIEIKEGEMFLLPAKIPHSPIRPENTIGLVIEKKRNDVNIDGLIWYCDSCNHKLFEEYFPLTNIEKDFIPVFRKFYTNQNLRTCDNCGTEMKVDERFI